MRRSCAMKRCAKQREDARTQAEEERLEQERRNAVLQERNRIAQEIHDTLAQNLTAIHLQLAALQELIHSDNAEIRSQIERLQELARWGLAETRRSVQALRPQILEHSNLVEAFLHLADEARASSALDVRTVIQGQPPPLPPSVEDHLLRMGQEAVTNVLRHAEATHLVMTLACEPGELLFEIRDDGKGFEPQQRREGFGLLGLQERARSIGGKLEIVSAPGRGARIVLRLSVEQAG